MDGERRRSPAEARRFWELAIDLRSSSGLSVAEFCIREGLKESSFYGWQQRLRNESNSSEAVATLAAESSPRPVAGPITKQPQRCRKHSRQSQDTGSLVPVRVVGDTASTAADLVSTPRPSSPIEILLPRGTRVRVEHGCDHELLRRVLAVLESLPC
jgi:hypothetical protein